jgi:hypothetical protein
VLVSLDGGNEPVWSPDGREPFYRETRQENPDLVAAQIATMPSLAVMARKRLFPIGEIVSTARHANYDVSPDGKTFVMVRSSPAARVVVIQNLAALVRRCGAGGIVARHSTVRGRRVGRGSRVHGRGGERSSGALQSPARRR